MFLRDVRLEPRIAVQDFLLVFRACIIEDYVADRYEQFLSLSAKSTGERVLAYDVDQSLAHPLPELLLRGPEFVIICADDPSRLLS
jgi:hypothetical protein